MRLFSKNKKNRLLVFLCCAVLTAGLLTGCGGAGGTGGSGGSGGDTDQNPGKASETARTIVVQETNGTTIVLDEAKVSTNAYKGMHLFSGNDVTVQEISDLTMLLDMDKYLYAEESTHFWLEATGTQENSQTTIYLDEGAELNRIVNPLEEGSVYQVHTPNSTMAVRGTVFRMEVRKGKDNKVYTDLAVLDGSVEVKLKTTTGEYNGVEETIDAGQAASIQADEETSEFITDENGSITTPVDYTSFPSGTVEKIIEYIDDGEEIAADKEELEKVAEDLKAQEEEQKEEAQKEEEQKEEEHEHEWQTVTVRQADCTKEGLSQAVCSVCGETGEQQTIPVTGHKASANWTTEKEATCTEEGTQVKTCSVCGEVLESRQVSKAAHKPGEEQTIEATCTEPGSVSVVCLLCGHTVEEHLLEALGHQPGNWVVIQPADYGVEGSQSQFCTVCGQLLGTQSIPALIPEPVPEPEACKHEVKEWAVTDATCTTAGSRTGTCSLCNEEVTEIISALGHKWSNWVETPATCTADGSKTRTCTREKCGASETEKTVDKLGHKPNETWTVTTAATCVTAGEESLKCTVCGDTLSTRSISATGHSFSDVWSYDENNHWHAATCEHATEKNDQAGHSGGIATCTDKAVCSTCGQAYGELASHTGGTATCTDKAVCSTCGQAYGELASHTGGTATCTKKAVCTACHQEYGELAAHTLSHVEKKDANCTETGNDEYWECTVCHKIFNDAQGKTEIEEVQIYSALGHQLEEDGWTVITDSTCTKEGAKTQTCGRCSTLVNETISKKEHTEGAVEVIQPTCTAEGKEFQKCTICGLELNSKVLTASGHTNGDPVYIGATCTEYGKTVVYCTVCGAEVSKKTDTKAPPLGHDVSGVAWEHEKLSDILDEEGMYSYRAYKICNRCHEIDPASEETHTHSEVWDDANKIWKIICDIIDGIIAPK